MRFKYVLLCVFTVAAAALVATPIQAQEQPMPNDSCTLGKWQVDVLYAGRVSCEAAYPTVGDPAFVEAADSGECTGVRYTVVSGNINQIAQAAVLAYNPSYLYQNGYVEAVAGPTSSNVVNAPCVGDSATNSGVGSCHEQAIRYNPDDVADGPFWFVVPGVRQLSATTLTLKSNKIDRCEILGVGDLMDENTLPAGCVPSCGNFDEDQSIIKTEVIDFDGCKARFDFDLNNGSVLQFGGVCDNTVFTGINVAYCCAEYYPDDATCGADCEFPAFYDLDDEDDPIIVELPDGTGVPLRFGDGLITIGTGTCSCRVIGGRVYCWGKPCPQ